MNMIFSLLVSLLAGCFIVFARMLNARLAERTGILQGTFLNYAVGLLFSLVFLWFSREGFAIGALSPGKLPAYAFFGGLVGVMVVVLSNYATSKISAFYMTLIIFMGQLVAGIVIDWMMLRTFSSGKAIGGLLVLFGLGFNLVMDQGSRKSDKTLKFQ